MDAQNVIGHAALVTVVWLLFVVNVHRFMTDSPPQVNVVPSQTMVIDGVPVEVPMVDAETLKSGEHGSSFMTEEMYQVELAKYKRSHMLHGVWAIVCALATFLIGWRLWGRWDYGLACVVSGPGAVAYAEWRKS